MSLPVLNIRDVVETQLCCGCGACAGVQPELFEMRDAPELGRRPAARNGRIEAGADARAFAACPGRELAHGEDIRGDGLIDELLAGWGPVRGVWEGHAADEDVRRRGSSGGAATALSLYAIERAGMHGVLHTVADEARPVFNRTTLSRTREELLTGTGSRYAPASPCEGLPRIEAAPGPCVFVGKPCDVAGVQRARRLHRALDEKVGLTIAFFCAGTPSTRGTVELLRSVGVRSPEDVIALRYRGNGWPGRWTVRYRDGVEEREASLSYDESWGFLQRYRQWRCYICPDHTGEFADVSVGDPWYRPVQEGEAGKSLIVARTARGVRIVQEAAAAGYLTLETEDSTLLPRSQPNLLSTRGRLWGQMVALRLAGAPAPRYEGFETRRWWLRLPLKTKLQSTVGTLRRIGRKGLKRRSPAPGWEGGGA